MIDPSLNRSRRFRAEWTTLGAVLLLVGGLLGGTLLRERRSIEVQEGDRLQVQARVVDENLIRQLEGANKALLWLKAELGRLGAHADNAVVTDKLMLLTSAMPGVSSMLVLDADGTIVASSREGLVGKNFKQREYFDAPRRAADSALLHVSPPFKTTSGTFVVVVSRALRDEHGAFAGVITATLDPGYFNVVLRSVLYAPDMRTTLIHADGKVFLDAPADQPGVEVDAASPTSLFSRFRASGLVSAVVDGTLSATGPVRMVALRSINRDDLRLDKPLVVAVSRETAAVDLSWRDRALQFGGLFASLIVGSIVGLRVNQRRRHAEALIASAVLRERQIGSERVELALRGADLGLWDLHVPSNDYVINVRERELLGFTSDDELPRGAAWKELIHPDDRALVDAAILPHLRGEASTYECEHRMRHRDGRWIWLSNRAMIVERSATGAPIRIVGTHLDITERKRSEQQLALAARQLAENEEQLRQVTDNLPALVSRLDADLKFRFVNRAYGDWLNIEESSLLGRSLSEVYGEPTWQTIRHYFVAAAAGNRVVYEREFTTPQGVRRVEVTLVPLMSHDGSLKSLCTLMHDITARHEAEHLRMRSEERLSLALEGSSLALFDWNIATGAMFHSAQAEAMRGEPPNEITATVGEFESLVHPDDLAAMSEGMKNTITGATAAHHAEFRVRCKDGEWLWLRARGRVVERDGNGRALRVAGTYADINERKIAEGRLRHLAEFDSLTDLPNRALFNDRLQEAMKRAARGKPMALLFLDIDRFKSINDTLGHEAGDELLKVFARRMTASVRQSDTVARLAGDEFTIILEGLTGLHDAQMLAGKLVEALREPINSIGDTLEVTASIGVAWCVAGERDHAALLRRADAALYEAKRRGRDRYFCDDSGDQSTVAVTEHPTLSTAHLPSIRSNGHGLAG